MDTSALSFAFSAVFTPINMLVILGGTVLGIFIGAMPGMSSPMGLSIMLPFTFQLHGYAGIMMLLGIFCGSIYGGSISASLLNTPGTAASAATCLDAYPMSVQMRQPGRALGISTFSSLCGGLFSCVVLVFGATYLRRALTRRAVDKDDVLDVLCAVGGLDIAAMTGAFLGCARERIPAVVDGFISVVAALCAVTLCPEVRDYLFLSHDSYEVGYRLAADRLGLEPCLHLGMRLGEGSGCPLLFRVLEGACGVMAGMATFAQAAIQDDYLDEIRAGDSFTVDKP